LQSKHYAGIGSRETPDEVCDLMKEIANRLKILGYTLRSGGAVGADKAFESGAGRKIIFGVDSAAVEENSNKTTIDYSQDDCLFMDGFVHKFHPMPSAIGRKGWKLLRRNTLQIVQHNLQNLQLPAVDFVVCWTPDGSIDGSKKSSGGTGQALRIASQYGIPVFNLKLGDSELFKLAKLIKLTK
jgi:hypothetical protein